MKYLLLVLLTIGALNVSAEQQSYLQQAKKVGENVWIGPQPTENDFNEFAAEEVTAVINTRTQAEMEQLKFDESQALKQYDIEYGLVEIGKGHDYSPVKLTEFNDLMVANEGKKMVLHCRSGHRASQLYAAWLIKYKGKTEAEALKTIQSDETELTDSMKALLDQ
ncbi:MAG: dual specificity protein phosphatase family protein [Xanthomonadales bacterium]|nr:dual specificity protein phosphatase family protein [Xanthomonadales bacterium]